MSESVKTAESVIYGDRPYQAFCPKGDFLRAAKFIDQGLESKQSGLSDLDLIDPLMGEEASRYIKNRSYRVELIVRMANRLAAKFNRQLGYAGSARQLLETLSEDETYMETAQRIKDILSGSHKNKTRILPPPETYIASFSGAAGATAEETAFGLLSLIVVPKVKVEFKEPTEEERQQAIIERKKSDAKMIEEFRQIAREAGQSEEEMFGKGGVEAFLAPLLSGSLEDPESV